MTSSLVRPFVAATVLSLTAATVQAQAGVGAHLTPYAGYFVTGNWYDGPVGTSLATTNAPMLGVQAKDWIGRFNSEDAIGFRTEGNLAHNWALTAGVALRF